MAQMQSSERSRNRTSERRARVDAPTSTYRSTFSAPNVAGKEPWRLRWLGLIPIAVALVLGSAWAWGRAETELDRTLDAHLRCEGIDLEELSMSWSYRTVVIDGLLPEGITAADIERTARDGSANDRCIEEAGLDPNRPTGIAGVVVAAEPAP